MVRIVVALGVALALAGCSWIEGWTGTGEPAPATTCERPDFPETVRCLHSALSPQPDARDADLASLYLAWLDAAAGRVEGGLLREADARLDAAELYGRLLEARRQKQPATVGAPKRYAGFLAGVAQWRPEKPLPAYAAGSPRPVCTMGGNGDMRCI